MAANDLRGAKEDLTRALQLNSQDKKALDMMAKINGGK